MKRTAFFILLFALAALSSPAVAQWRDVERLRRAEQGKVGVNPDEVVSFEETFPYNRAIQTLNELSKKFADKPVIDLMPKDSLRVIGVEIRALPWRDALNLIARYNNAAFTEEEDHFRIISLTDLATLQQQADAAQKLREQQEAMAKMAEQQAKAREAVKDTSAKPGEKPVTPVYVMPEAPKVDTVAQAVAFSQEVRISAIFVAIDQSKLKESGLSFSIFRGRDLNLQVEFQGAGRVTSPLFGASVNPQSDRLTVDVSAALNFFENTAIGEVISRPEVTVRSGVEGRMQVGVDFSVKERTISGDVIDRFFSSGIILTATPKVFSYEGLNFVSLKLEAEKSDVVPDPVSTRVNRTKNTTTMTLLSGEQMYVGGLYSTEDQVVRQGIPILKDLPWWVFGLRYLFGYDRTQSIKKDIIIFVRAELVPTPYERAKEKLKEPATRELLQKKHKELEKEKTVDMD